MNPSCLEVGGLSSNEIRETLFEMTFVVEFPLLQVVSVGVVQVIVGGWNVR